MTGALHRPVITGVGILAPNGVGTESFWEGVLTCRSGIRRIQSFDASNQSFPIAGEVPDFCLCDYTNGQFKPKRLARHTQLALAATRMAVDQAGLDAETLARNVPLPITVGISSNAMEIFERSAEAFRKHGPGRVTAYSIGSGLPHAMCTALGELLGVRSQRLSFSSACSAGLDALAYSSELIAEGRTDLAITGGVDACITPLTLASFAVSGLLPHDGMADPATLSRPFDLNRQGGVMSEGAGMFVVESLGHALGRGATPLAWVRGFGSCGETSGSPAGVGLADSMAGALANSGLHPADIDYVCAHGPSDPVIDRTETAMIKQVFDRRARQIPVSSIKGVTGNPLSAAGPLQVAATLLAMRDGLVPPTAHYETPDPWCDLDYVPNRPYRMEVRRAMINLHGLGGGNSSLVLEKVRSA